MIDLTPSQLVKLWSQLEQAYYSDNKYGGNVAEIYAYTVMPMVPSLMLETRDWNHEAFETAKLTLCHVLRWFCKDRECVVEIDGYNLDAWQVTAHFDHRCHVKVIR